ncbi:hypothetical protein [Prosthecochloris sp. GSB1]|uniref:hypothetical protein n=1 Tax=Prosthecochloris sp. GSB1 TaxID=281093 RepID=UPI00123743F0|nr:hypothetical protein [Prosthecochloris sp. GSB1]
MENLGPAEFALKISSDPKMFIDLIFVPDVEKELKEKGYDLPENYVAYINASLDKVRGYITDQGHVLEVKANQANKDLGPEVKNSGNGAAGTGWGVY